MDDDLIRRIKQREQDRLTELGNLGARSWLSYQIFCRGADLATILGMGGFRRTEAAINRLSGTLLARSIRRDRRKWNIRSGGTK